MLSYKPTYLLFWTSVAQELFCIILFVWKVSPKCIVWVIKNGSFELRKTKYLYLQQLIFSDQSKWSSEFIIPDKSLLQNNKHVIAFQYTIIDKKIEYIYPKISIIYCIIISLNKHPPPITKKCPPNRPK